MAAAAAAAAARSCASHGGGGGGGGCFLLAAAAFLAAFVLVGASAHDAGDAATASHVMLRLEDIFPDSSSSSCETPPQDHEHAASSSSSSSSSHTRMTVVHRHGPCSHLSTADTQHRKPPPSHEDILAADQNRVKSIQHRVAATTSRAGKQPSFPTTSSSVKLPASSGLALGTGNYVATVGIGTPATRQTVVVDTGSDTTWVQCRPCVASCYAQREALFDPARSSTYSNVSCAAAACSDLDVRGCSAGHCLYGVQYGDGSFSVGFFAMDTLSLSSYDSIKGFKFGCGESNDGLFGEASGLLGLGRGKTSLPMQAYAKYGGVFSHCLPARPTSTGYLNFGPTSPPPATQTTPMLTTNGPTFYYVGMTGIHVAGRLLPIPPSVFSSSSSGGGGGGTIVDSGTVITRLPPAAYAALRSAFVAAMAARGYRRAAAAAALLDTCYDFSGMGGVVAIPKVVLLFQGGAYLDVDASGIMYAVRPPSQVCLGFAANDGDGDVGIVGNTQLKTFGVVYDLGKSMVGFSPGAC
uniref:Peptidase A1 domain-containing protein n=1 Tax=Leersia perrieri TaxID=77586 RepID=A0A0D9WS25_9ORYZ